MPASSTEDGDARTGFLERRFVVDPPHTDATLTENLWLDRLEQSQ